MEASTIETHFTPQQIAVLMDCKPNTVIRSIRKGALEAVKVWGKYRVPLSSLEAFLSAHQVVACPKEPMKVPDLHAAPPQGSLMKHSWKKP